MPSMRTGIAIHPGKAHSLHLTSVAIPDLGPSDVLIDVRNVGICGTDRELIEAKFGSPPPGSNELVLGHEAIGTVAEVGARVTSVKPGDYVVATVRRPCDCPPCQANQSDYCVSRGYVEHGIIGLHGFMIEQFVTDEKYLVVVPPELAPIGVLLEPLSVVEKAYRAALAIRSGLPSWSPKTAVVFGAGPIGLLGTMLLRAEGLDVYTVARSVTPNRSAAFLAEIGAYYVSSREQDPNDLIAAIPNIDIIFECSGGTQPVIDSLSMVGNNGVVVLLSIAADSDPVSIPLTAINREFVLGNKAVVGSVNAHRDDFAAGLLHLEHFERLWPGQTEKLITHRFKGFEPALAMMEVTGIKSIIDVG